jgi:hypothetical protein
MADVIAITLDTAIGVLSRIGTLLGDLCPANNARLHRLKGQRGKRFPWRSRKQMGPDNGYFPTENID